MNAKEIIRLQTLLESAEVDLRESVSKAVKSARESSNQTQDQFAKKLGISRTQYVNLESGRHNFTLYNFTLACALLNIDANKLLGL